MAIAFADVVTHSRKKGHSAVAAAAYRTRSRLVDERTGEVHDYTYKKDDLEGTRLVMPRAGQPWLQSRREAGLSELEIRSQLWNGAEFSEHRYDARVSRDLTVAMPWELTRAQRDRVSYEIARYIADEYAFEFERQWMENRQKKRETVPLQGHGVAIEYAMHKPHEKADDLNFHTHFLLSVRRMDANGFTEKAAELDNPKISSPHIEAWRQGIARIVNRALERAGYDESHFIDMRSYERQGLDREAQIHMGPSAAALERDGIPTDVGDHNRDVKARNAARAREEQRHRLNEKSNVIDFEEKRAARDRRRQQEHLHRQAVEREGRMRDALKRQRQLEEQLKRKREAEEKQRLDDEHKHEAARDEEDRSQSRDADDVFDRDAYLQKWQDEVDQAGIEADAKRRSPGNQWQVHAVDPELERQAKVQAERERKALHQKRQEQIQAFKERTPEDQRPPKLSPQFDRVKDKLPDDPRLRQAWRQHHETAEQYAEIDEWANQRRAETQSRMHFELIDLDRRHGREKELKEAELSKLYGDARRENEQRIKAIETRQERGGLFYRITARRRDDRELANLQKTVENSRWREDEMRQTYQNVHQREREAVEQRYAREREIDEQQIEQAWNTGRIPEPRFREASPVEAAPEPSVDEGASPDRDHSRRKRVSIILPPPKPALAQRHPAPGGMATGHVRQPQPARQETRPDVSQQKPAPDFIEVDADVPAPKPNQEPGEIAGSSPPDFLDDDKMAEGWKKEIKQYGEGLTRQQERGHSQGGDFSS